MDNHAIMELKKEIYIYQNTKQHPWILFNIDIFNLLRNGKCPIHKKKNVSNKYFIILGHYSNLKKEEKHKFGSIEIKRTYRIQSFIIPISKKAFKSLKKIENVSTTLSWVSNLFMIFFFFNLLILYGVFDYDFFNGTILVLILFGLLFLSGFYSFFIKERKRDDISEKVIKENENFDNFGLPFRIKYKFLLSKKELNKFLKNNSHFRIDINNYYVKKDDTEEKVKHLVDKVFTDMFNKKTKLKNS